MNNHCSLILILTVNNNHDWTWLLLHRNVNKNTISNVIQIPQHHSQNHPENFLKNKLNYSNIYQLRKYGNNLSQILFPDQILKEIEKHSHGDILFSVPTKWSDIPFELCYLKDKGFLGELFQIGTIISSIPTLPQKHTKSIFISSEMLIIINRSLDAPYVSQEGKSLKELFTKKKLTTRIINNGNKIKILSAIEKASFIHFAGHSNYENNCESLVWPLQNNDFLTEHDISTLKDNPSVPCLIFSNSCHSGKCHTLKTFSGIASAFLRIGVPIVIGSIDKINDADALKFSQHFYKDLLNNYNLIHGVKPAKSLLNARKSMLSHKPDSITPLLYRFYGDPKSTFSLKLHYKELFTAFLPVNSGVIAAIIVLISTMIFAMAFQQKIDIFINKKKIVKESVTSSFTNAKIVNSNTPVQSETIKIISYLAPSFSDEFQEVAKTSIEKTFASIGYTVITYNAQNKMSRQLNQFEMAIKYSPKPKAIILAAVDFEAVTPLIKRARKNNIAVIAFDRKITNTVLDFSSVAATKEIGIIAAQKVALLLKKKYQKVKGTIIQIMGDPHDSYTVDIKNSFENKISYYSDITCITKTAMHWDAKEASEIVKTQLLLNPNIDLIYVHAAHLALPIIEILKNKNKQPGDIFIVSSNGAPVGHKLIRDGWEQIEIEQPLYAQVHGMVMFINRIIDKKDIKPGEYDILGHISTLTKEKWGMNLEIPGSVIDSTNVDDLCFWGNYKN